MDCRPSREREREFYYVSPLAMHRTVDSLIQYGHAVFSSGYVNLYDSGCCQMTSGVVDKL
jgi:hypothetical protein